MAQPHPPVYHTPTRIWAMIFLMVVGFAVAGLGVILGGNWLVLGVGIAAILVGGIGSLAMGVMGIVH